MGIVLCYFIKIPLLTLRMLQKSGQVVYCLVCLHVELNAENPLGPSSMYPRVAIVALVVDDVVSSSYTFTFVLLRLSVLLVLGVLGLLLPQQP